MAFPTSTVGVGVVDDVNDFFVVDAEVDERLPVPATPEAGLRVLLVGVSDDDDWLDKASVLDADRLPDVGELLTTDPSRSLVEEARALEVDLDVVSVDGIGLELTPVLSPILYSWSLTPAPQYSRAFPAQGNEQSF